MLPAIDGGMLPAIDGGMLPAIDVSGRDSGHAMICVNDNCITVLPEQNGDINIIG